MSRAHHHHDLSTPRSPQDLPMLDGAVLWSMRAWAIGLSRGLDVGAEIAGLFDLLGTPAATPCHDAFMQALNRGAMRMLEVNCVCHPEVSEDEQVLLDIFALHQEGREHDARGLLEKMIMPEHARAANEAAGRLVARLNEGGRVFENAIEALRRHAFGTWSGQNVIPFSRRLH